MEGSSREPVTIHDSVDDEATDLSSPQPCLRHISSIQIRNLSPFPARDSVASALTQRSTVGPKAGSGSRMSSDDVDILIGQRRKRRISSASIRTFLSEYSDHGQDTRPPHSSVKHSRTRTNSKSSANLPPEDCPSISPVRRQMHGSPSEVRRRRRRASEASLPEDVMPPWQVPNSTSSSWLINTVNSQKQLEEIIWSRLVETFLTVNLTHQDESSTISPRPELSAPIPKNRKGKSVIPKPLSVDFKGTLQLSSLPTHRSRGTASMSISSVATSHHSVVSPSARSSADDCIITELKSQAPNSPGMAMFPQSPPLTPPPAASPNSSLVPIYISPVYRPSTNPKFTLDPEDPALARRTDLSADSVVIRLWAKLGADPGLSPEAERLKGKEKAEQDQENHHANAGPPRSEWQVLCEWDVHISDLVPLPDNFVEHPEKLPANTLILNLSLSNRPYYIPSTLLGVSPIPSRAHSPDYNSDSEVSRRRPPSKSILSVGRGRDRKSGRRLKSANLNELVKLVALQESLLDAQSQLQDVVDSCNRLMEEDIRTVFRRESSEREYQLQRLQERKDLLDDDIRSVRDDIASRREQLRQRRMRLAEARTLHEDGLLTEFDAGVRLAEEKKLVGSLRSQIEPVRTSLLSTLAFIFPIELFSPPDLLYTILGVPLPIPLQGTDPAPPLSLPHMPEVSEDGVATALGYAALLVHLMATYLCQQLVYPITYIGSRSLVKDPISAMMGPRMFPLYSKGVDTYRFEYAVFLLNKDIEMLMAERNLRALDLRHTLPNLKNLLLTLTSGEAAIPRSRHLYSPSVVSITSGLQSPSPYSANSGTSEPPALSLENDDAGSSTTPKGRAVGLPSVDASDDTTGTDDSSNKNMDTMVVTSSSTTQGISDAPSTSAIEDRSGASSGASTLRPRLPRIQIQSYLGLPPLSSMWKGRGTSTSSVSSSRTAETSETASQEETPELSSTSADGNGSVESDDTSESGEDEEDEEDDRRTVRGTSVPTTPIAGTRPRRASIAPDGLIENLKDLKARVHSRGGNNVAVNAEIEKHADPVEDRDAVVNPAC